jgi:phospholipase C
MRRRSFIPALPVIGGLALALSGCSGSSAANPSSALPLVRQQTAPQQRLARMPDVRDLGSRGKIKHVVIVMQENRSFNNLFYGFKGATWASYGYDSNGNKVTLNPIGLETTWDIDHSSNAFFAACNGTGSIPGTNCQMNGFNQEWVGCRSSCPYPEPQYAYVPHSETAPYFAMGKQYVLADQMYASNFDASSFISHQYIISGQAGNGAVNYPDSNWGCPGGPYDKISKVGPQRQIPDGNEVVCWDPNTLGDELDGKSLSWAFYGVSYSNYPWLWMAYQAIKHIYNGPDWTKDNISPPSQFLNDVSNGNLRTVSWVTPTWTNSDHAGSGSNSGPSWVTSVVNAVGESQYWNSTAIFILWDDYGGWYDSQPPAYVDYDGLGFRLPLLIISPYAKKNHVSHVHYEHGSILKFVEDTFGLGRLTASDTRANSPARDCFNFRNPPRAFVPIQAPLGINYFKHQAPDTHIPDAE